jgi:hypothetical protein
MSNSYIYCFIRKDLPVVHQLIQVGHACHEAGKWFEEPNPKMELDEPANMVLFEVENEEELIKASNWLYFWEIEYIEFKESDMNNEFTSICTQIIDTEEKRNLFRGFKLYNDKN